MKHQQQRGYRPPQLKLKTAKADKKQPPATMPDAALNQAVNRIKSNAGRCLVRSRKVEDWKKDLVPFKEESR